MTSNVYKEIVLEHYRHPRNRGELVDANAQARESNVLCGDVIEMQLKLKGDEIEDIRFQGEGCAISQAAASMLTELSKGNTVSFVKKLGRDDVLKLLGADPGPARMTCALLGLKVLKMAVYARLGEEMPREFEEE